MSDVADREPTNPELARLARSIHDSMAGLAGYWQQLATLACTRHGYGSLEHDLARERVHFQLGVLADVRETVRLIDGDAVDAVTAALCEREGLPAPGDRDAYWPRGEQETHRDRVTAARPRIRGRRGRRDARARWRRLLAEGRRELGIDFTLLAQPDWILSGPERLQRRLRRTRAT